MLVLGKYAVILAYDGNNVDLSPFTQYYQDLEKVLILYAEVQNTFQYMAKV